MAPGLPSAVRRVPSTGPTATSPSGGAPWPPPRSPGPARGRGSGWVARWSSGDLDDEGVALAPASAEGGATDAPAGPPESVDEGDHEGGAGGSQGGAEGDRPAVHVHLVARNAQQPGRPEGDGGEGLVHLD